MSPVPQVLQFLVVAVAGWINQQPRDVIDSLGVGAQPFGCDEAAVGSLATVTLCLFPKCCSSSSWPSRAGSTSSRVTSLTLSALVHNSFGCDEAARHEYIRLSGHGDEALRGDRTIST